ncbi:anhydro-N-acetylmuramic acid kinase [Pseudonocardia sp. MH-G8]|uniref:anhydro-N-acetylmuramic acid kinase n=1 Tax=Pseudonocardia sp. MH-G8 TaxID=1854588 RepID=UPI000BA0ECE4|nr:anhydro-N-acetylmuramic acid kinase [Pseudonocardia sp. MH-G8]OZM75921.1 anhydro-N-acetylmuramic acid kinase [Pseudonocardia sp. MH-G8]
MKVLGMISGTSHDGIDAAVVDFRRSGDALHGQVTATSSTPYDPALRARILAALPPADTSLAEVCELDTLIGQAFADAAEKILATTPVDAVCSHGQTVFHWVHGGRALGTLQLGQPAWIAERLGVPVVADVRIRDIAVGGQGAPLVSYLDTLLLGALPGQPAALNLGGIANMTVPGAPGGPLAWDIGPANALVDAAVLRTGTHPAGYDADGALAARGRVDEDMLADLLAEPYYRLPAPKSTGKELFHDGYVAAALARHARPVEPADLVATLTALTAQTVADAVRGAGVDTLVVSGGGCANPTMMRMLADRLPGVRLATSAELGAPPPDKEAIAFALIGWQTLHGLPATLPTATGASAPRVLGAITPGAGPLRLPEPLTGAPASLRLTAAEGVAG